jgi:hypothetical protein
MVDMSTLEDYIQYYNMLWVPIEKNKLWIVVAGELHRNCLLYQREYFRYSELEEFCNIMIRKLTRNQRQAIARSTYDGIIKYLDKNGLIKCIRTPETKETKIYPVNNKIEQEFKIVRKLNEEKLEPHINVYGRVNFEVRDSTGKIKKIG